MRILEYELRVDRLLVEAGARHEVEHHGEMPLGGDDLQPIDQLADGLRTGGDPARTETQVGEARDVLADDRTSRVAEPLHRLLQQRIRQTHHVLPAELDDQTIRIDPRLLGGPLGARQVGGVKAAVPQRNGGHRVWVQMFGQRQQVGFGDVDDVHRVDAAVDAEPIEHRSHDLGGHVARATADPVHAGVHEPRSGLPGGDTVGHPQGAGCCGHGSLRAHRWPPGWPARMPVTSAGSMPPAESTTYTPAVPQLPAA